MKVWILCSSSIYFEKYIIDYQKNRLSNYAKKHNHEVVGVLKEISYIKGLDTFGMRSLFTEIRRHSIDILLVTSRTRICSDNDLLEEFELFCNACGVSIIEIGNS